ncbi:MAG: D-alanyl-D-alanine carboxypeptidase [Clostridia bacterium]|nr:D-alanyl-D-alanine carboxypeptidase [Clostridia bacterium]
MKIFNALVCLFICAAVLFSPVCGAKTVSSECDISDVAVPIASDNVEAPIGTVLEIKARSAVLLEPDTLTVLYEDNPDEKLPPASITKIMSLILIMEAIDRGDLKLQDRISASDHAAGMGGSQIWLKPGEKMTVDDLLKAAVIASANDATVALAEAVAGSEEGFVALMNDKAKSLGMTGTVFKNATGLDAEGHLSTAADVARMSAELLKHPLIKNYSTVWMDSLRGGESELVNTNKLVRFYDGTTGLKTGTTADAGYCLAASAERDGMELVAVIMGGETSPARFEGAKKLLDYGFANYSIAKINPDFKNGTEIAVSGGEQSRVPLLAQGGMEILLKKGAAAEITQKTELPETLKAPVKKRQKVGLIRVMSGKDLIGDIDIVAAKEVKRMSFIRAFLWMATGLFTA